MNSLIRRLIESSDQVVAKAGPLPVVVDSKPQQIYKCPHCQQEIHEKHTYVEEGVDYHSDCNGAIKWPATDWSTVDPKWRDLLMPHVKE